MVWVIAWIIRGSVILGSSPSCPTVFLAILKRWSSSEANDDTEERRVIGVETPLRPVLNRGRGVVPPFDTGLGIPFPAEFRVGVRGLFLYADAGMAGGPIDPGEMAGAAGMAGANGAFCAAAAITSL